jgi:CBS domain-containing protein
MACLSYPERHMPVGDLGPDEVVTTERDSTLSDVAEQLRTENVGAAVVAEDDEPVGIVTDRDIALAVAESDEVASMSAEEVMTEDPAALPEDAEAMEISRTIEEQNVRRIPVVDENDQLTGIVTLDDLVATIGEQLDNVSETIEAQSPDYEP